MKTLKVVLDTNVFVSGIFFTGPPYKIIRAWQDNLIQIAVTEEIIEEYIRVIKALSVKFENINLGSILETLLIEAELVPSYSFKEAVCEDPDDDKFITCAIAAKSRLIVSGDKHLLNIGKFLNIQIVTPRYFVDNIL